MKFPHLTKTTTAALASGFAKLNWLRPNGWALKAQTKTYTKAQSLMLTMLRSIYTICLSAIMVISIALLAVIIKALVD